MYYYYFVYVRVFELYSRIPWLFLVIPATLSNSDVRAICTYHLNTTPILLICLLRLNYQCLWFAFIYEMLVCSFPLQQPSWFLIWTICVGNSMISMTWIFRILDFSNKNVQVSLYFNLKCLFNKTFLSCFRYVTCQRFLLTTELELPPPLVQFDRFRSWPIPTGS